MADMTEAERAAMTEWALVAFDEAVAAGWIIPPWRPTSQAYETMYGYFGMGMTPAEGAEAMFATRQ